MIKPSEFDSDIFGIKIGSGTLKDVAAMAIGLKQTSFELIFVKGPYPAEMLPHVAYYDVRYDFVAEDMRGKLGVDGFTSVMQAREEHLLSCQQIAASAFTNSRYYRDSWLAPSAPEVYRRWVKNSYDRGELFVHLNSEYKPDGFMCVSHTKDDLRIDLIATSHLSRGQGAGKQMVMQFLLMDGPLKRRVKTSVDNLSAVRLYLRNGFTIEQVESVQHLWPERS